jgi:hypothetical protein
MQVREDWNVKMAALQLSQPLVTYFSKPLESCMPALMGASWQLLLAAQVCRICAQQMLHSSCSTACYY